MRALIQRVAGASVTIDEQVVGRIGAGLLVYLGVAEADGDADLEYIASKTRHVRVFPDDQGRMNLDVAQAGGAVLVVSNFTLLADVRKGRRPAFVRAAPPERANALYERLCERLRALGLEVRTGRFRERMRVEAINEGPVNLLVDSADRA